MNTEFALFPEISDAGLSVRRQHSVDVYYNDRVVGVSLADLIVEQQVLVEIKSARRIEDVNTAPCLNYLKANWTDARPAGNFGTPTIRIKRFRT